MACERYEINRKSANNNVYRQRSSRGWPRVPLGVPDRLSRHAGLREGPGEDSQVPPEEAGPSRANRGSLTLSGANLTTIPVVTGANFGDCKCGHAKAAHSAAALAAGPAPPPAKTQAAAPKEDYRGPCDNFTGEFRGFSVEKLSS